MIGWPVKQRAILGHDPLKFIEHLADSLQVRQFSPGYHDEAAAGSAEAVERRRSGVVEHAIMSQGAVVIAREDETFHH